MKRFKRKIFFLIERLEISRSERITIVLLFILLIILSGYALVTHPAANYDPEHYRELEEVFAERSKVLQTEKEEILARYKPEIRISAEAGAETGSADVIKAPENGRQLEEAGRVSIMIDINNATKEELQQLPGIGPAYADRIIQWRADHGPFTSPDQLLEVRGIGDRRLEQLVPYIHF